MARRKAESTIETRVSITPIPLESAQLEVVGEKSDLWTADVLPILAGWRGSFVVLRPPVTASDATIEKVRAAFVQAGVAAIRVDRPKQAAPLVDQRMARVKCASIREVVDGLVTEAPSKDPSRLRQLIEETLAGVGL
jgi:hypothetical protein